MKVLRILFLTTFLLSSHPLWAQLSLGANPQPAAPQTAALTRYVNHGARKRIDTDRGIPRQGLFDTRFFGIQL